MVGQGFDIRRPRSCVVFFAVWRTSTQACGGAHAPFILCLFCSVTVTLFLSLYVQKGQTASKTYKHVVCSFLQKGAPLAHSKKVGRPAALLLTCLCALPKKKTKTTCSATT